MKCLVLSGGKGDRLWPLSRQEYPKQFIGMQKNHSLFQETIARNIPFCDEFIIVTNEEYKFIIEDQMKSFQDITYRCVFEGVGRKTTAAIILSCMQLPLSELVYVVAADQIVEGENYKETVMTAKEWAKEGYLVTIGQEIKHPETRFGYIRYSGNDVQSFVEKPDEETARAYMESGDYLTNTGMFLFQVGDLLAELEKCSKDVFLQMRGAYKKCIRRNGNIYYPEAVLKQVDALPIERTVFEKTEKARVVRGDFKWQDIGSLKDLSAIDIRTVNRGYEVQNNCENVMIVNQCGRRLVVADGVEDLAIVNTQDAVYVGKNGESEGLKQIMNENEHLAPFFKSGRVSYRSWGTYELLVDEPTYRVKRIMIRAGKTIYAHKHLYRSEYWTLVSGTAKITLDGCVFEKKSGDCILVEPGMVHQISNAGDEPLSVIEVSVGSNVTEDDMVSVQSKDLTDRELGYAIDPVVKLEPAYKDYLWGGNRLKSLYNKKCEYDIVAESWELSAHEAGVSVVTSGRHKGLNFAKYLKMIGKENWGWKCQSLPNFPILIKFIDAKDKLSVQVHPDDEFALEQENEYGKNEMWYVVDCEEGAGIYCGFNRDVSKEEVRRRVEDNTILEILNWIPAKKGDVFFIKAGTVHAIGAGMLVCEIQQSSNCTYRLYDFDRRDKYGHARELHLDKALEVLNYKKYEPDDGYKTVDGPEEGKEQIAAGEFGQGGQLLGRCKYFESYSYPVSGSQTISMDPNSFCSLVCVSGSGTVCAADGMPEEAIVFEAGDSMFVPAGEGKLKITGECELVVTHV